MDLCCTLLLFLGRFIPGLKCEWRLIVGSRRHFLCLFLVMDSADGVGIDAFGFYFGSVTHIIAVLGGFCSGFGFQQSSTSLNVCL